MKRCAFEATNSYRSKHTATFNFMNPAAAALWNMRWQVRGYVDASPGASETEVFGRFAAGSGLRAGNLQRIFVDEPWEQQLGQFGELLLHSSIAVYEGWVAELLHALGLPAADKSAVEKLLTSSHVRAAVAMRGMNALMALPSSPVAETHFKPGLLAQSTVVGLAQLPTALLAMRGYKTIRNAITHRSGLLTDDDVQAVTDASNVSGRDLRMRADPAYVPVTSGDRVAMSYQAAVGCSAVLLRIVNTIDAELGGSRAAEEDALRSRADRRYVGTGLHRFR